MNAADLNELAHDSKQAQRIEDLLLDLQTVKPVTNFVRVVEMKWASKNTFRSGTKSAQIITG